jgi:hypothetical protein
MTVYVLKPQYRRQEVPTLGRERCCECDESDVLLDEASSSFGSSTAQCNEEAAAAQEAVLT